MKTIRVTQSASEKLSPDAVTVDIRLVAEHKKYAESMAALNKKTEAVSALLTNAGLKRDEIFSSGSSVYTARRDNKQYYTARTELKVKLALSDERVERVLSALEDCGEQWSTGYALTDDGYKSSLVKRAVDAAKRSAETLAVAAGVKLGELCKIEYAPSFQPAMLRAAALGGEPERINAEETVTCEWAIE